MKNMQVKTPIGTLTFSVEAKMGDIDAFNISTCQIEPIIPDEMSVEGSTAVLLSGNSAREIRDLSFSCNWDELKEPGYGASGEALDAWEWESNEVLVMIGTEDYEWLNSRLKVVGELDTENYPITMKENKITIRIEKYEANRELTLHFIVSWNKLPEPVDCSCWYAVDVAHDRVIKACTQS